MSIPAEELHQQSLDILAKLASLHKNDDVVGMPYEATLNNNLSNMCPLCAQLKCSRNCDKENTANINNIDKQKVSKTPQKYFSLSEPVTPTANLKMLVSAASDLKPALAKEDKDAVVYDADGEYVEDIAMQKAKVKKGELMGRKEKSLGLLCKKFMSIYPEFSPLGTTVMLDDVVTSLGIGRRRVYDIVNVLESMEMMVRQAKNKYIWFGKSRLPETLAKLKALALRVYGANFCHMIKRVCHAAARQKCQDAVRKTCYILPKDYSIQPVLHPHRPPSVEHDNVAPLAGNDNNKDNGNSNNNNNDINNENLLPSTGQESKVDDFSHLMMDSIISYDLGRRDGNRSLGILCQKFIMLFMIAEENTVSLDRAAKLLITDPEEGPGKYKTKVRRLYDIANILTSINFLEKCVSYEESTKKAAYKWIGLDLKSINCEEDANKAFLSQEFSLTRHSLLTQAPRECYKLFNKNDKSQQRKFRFRSSSAHNIPSNQQSSTTSGANEMRSFYLRTLSDTMMNNEKNKNVTQEDGFSIETLEEEPVVNTCINTEKSNTVATTQAESPNQLLFKKKLRNLQKEFPDKLPGDGLLDLLSVCKDYSAAVPSRRRLSSDFDAQASGRPHAKKVKPELPDDTNYSMLNASQVGMNNIPSPVGVCKSTMTVHKPVAPVSKPVAPVSKPVAPIPQHVAPVPQPVAPVPKPAAPVSLSLFSNNNAGTNRLGNNRVVLNSDNIPPNSVKIGNLQQPAYFTIPATLKPIGSGGDSSSPTQNISTMLVSPLSNPLSLPKSGLYQIIPVQCHPVVERMDASSPGGQGTLIAKPSPKSSSDGLKLPEKSSVPLLLRPPVSTVTSPSVSISPIPSSLKTFTDSPVNHQQLSENYQEFVTPPHVLYHNFAKPPANPIMFPKMTPETPTSIGLSHSVLTNVTRKLALQKEDNITSI